MVCAANSTKPASFRVPVRISLYLSLCKRRALSLLYCPRTRVGNRLHLRRALRDEHLPLTDLQELVGGTPERALLETGDMSKGVFWAGMVPDLVDDTPS